MCFFGTFTSKNSAGLSGAFSRRFLYGYSSVGSPYVWRSKLRVGCTALLKPQWWSFSLHPGLGYGLCFQVSTATINDYDSILNHTKVQ